MKLKENATPTDVARYRNWQILRVKGCTESLLDVAEDLLVNTRHYNKFRNRLLEIESHLLAEIEEARKESYRKARGQKRRFNRVYSTAITTPEG